MGNLLNREIFTQKMIIRKNMRQKRGQISPFRREQASSKLLKTLVKFLEPYKKILSFANFGSEIETSHFNRYLALSDRLLLPKMEKNGELSVYQTALECLTPNTFGIPEPDPSCSIFVEPKNIEAILVPGLGFDRKLQRIGYGKGFYDRFLQSHSLIPSFGIGFLEQLTDPLPCDEWDQAVSRLFLF
jgi:5-formyltetrahydrofolate cyclo-ligase